MPKIVNAEKDEARAEILSAIRAMLTALHAGKNVKIDFSRVRQMYPGGMLLFISFLERMLVHWRGRIRASCLPGSIAAQLLHHFGYGKQLGVPERRNNPQHPSVINWRHATGTEAEGAKVQAQIAHFEESVGHAMPEGLYDVLAEALINTRHHAYAGTEVPESLKRWWMFSSCRAPDANEPGGLYIAIYDMGVGIPEKMREKLQGIEEHVEAGLNSLMSRLGFSDFTNQDCQLLGVAIDENRSATGLPFRGRGLPEMREFAENTPGGRMTIISGHGIYRFHAGWAKPVIARCDPRLTGTLILWSLPLAFPEQAS